MEVGELPYVARNQQHSVNELGSSGFENQKKRDKLWLSFEMWSALYAVLISAVIAVEKLKNFNNTLFAELRIFGPLTASKLKDPEMWGKLKLDVGLNFFTNVEFFMTKLRLQ